MCGRQKGVFLISRLIMFQGWHFDGFLFSVIKFSVNAKISTMTTKMPSQIVILSIIIPILQMRVQRDQISGPHLQSETMVEPGLQSHVCWCVWAPSLWVRHTASHFLQDLRLCSIAQSSSAHPSLYPTPRPGLRPSLSVQDHGSAWTCPLTPHALISLLTSQ